MTTKTQLSKTYRMQQKQFYLGKQKKSQINNLTLHLKQLEREERQKPKSAEVKKS